MTTRRTIKAVSDDLDKLEIAHHGLDKAHFMLKRDVEENTKDIIEIASYFKWFMKVVVSLVAAAVVAFVVQGGLV